MSATSKAGPITLRHSDGTLIGVVPPENVSVMSQEQWERIKLAKAQVDTYRSQYAEGVSLEKSGMRKIAAGQAKIAAGQALVRDADARIQALEAQKVELDAKKAALNAQKAAIDSKKAAIDALRREMMEIADKMKADRSYNPVELIAQKKREMAILLNKPVPQENVSAAKPQIGKPIEDLKQSFAGAKLPEGKVGPVAPK